MPTRSTHSRRHRSLYVALTYAYVYIYVVKDTRAHRHVFRFLLCLPVSASRYMRFGESASPPFTNPYCRSTLRICTDADRCRWSDSEMATTLASSGYHKLLCTRLLICIVCSASILSIDCIQCNFRLKNHLRLALI